MDQRKARFWQSKYFRVDPVKIARFEAACRLLGLQEYEVFDKFLTDFLDEHANQPALENFLGGPRPFILQVDRVNVVANKVTLMVVKARLSEILLKLKENDEELDRITPHVEHEGRSGYAEAEDSFTKRWQMIQGRIAAGRVNLMRVLKETVRVPVEARDPELQQLVALAEEVLK